VTKSRKTGKPSKSRNNLVQIVLKSADALRIVRRLAQDSSAVFITDHASKRMVQRKVTRVQVIECLLKGVITEGPALDIKGSWKFTISRAVCGDALSAVVALDRDVDKSNLVIVVTVIRD
jgi:Domain of unknown function (DUF4258)